MEEAIGESAAQQAGVGIHLLTGLFCSTSMHDEIICDLPQVTQAKTETRFTSCVGHRPTCIWYVLILYVTAQLKVVDDRPGIGREDVLLGEPDDVLCAISKIGICYNNVHMRDQRI